MIRCPKCGSNEFRIHGVQYLRLYVTFTPDQGEPVIEDFKSDGETGWADNALTVCLGCDHETTFDTLVDPPRPVTLPRLRDLGPGVVPDGLAEECLAYLLDGQPESFALTNAALLTWVANYRMDRENWEAACDDLRASALEAEQDAREGRR